jgi:thiol-disulfide isomerase/thioredoxin
LLAAAALAFTCARWASAGGDWLDTANATSTLPALDGATAWINSPPLASSELRGKVVLVDFWTYSCINCLRTLPYVRAWAQKYRAHGLVVIGAHTPEFDFERNVENVQRAVKDLGIDYPVAVDSRQALWKAFGARAWPTLYFVDARGQVRQRQLGEGRYDQAERTIQQLLREAGRRDVPDDLVVPQGQGTQAAPGSRPPASDETYLNTSRAEGFVSSDGGLRAGRAYVYAGARHLALNQWTLAGSWKVDDTRAELAQPGGRIAYRFSARDLHLVLGPARDAKPIRFRIRIDGQSPGASRGTDVDAHGSGVIDARRLYQLVRQSESGREHVFEIEFLDTGAQAYAFTFG